MDSDLTAKVWERLVAGKSLTNLGLPSTDGRIDLRGLAAAPPSVIREYVTANADVKALENLIQLRGVHWKGIDFSNACLESLRFYDSHIEDCCFDRANCEEWRMWGTTISNSSFRSADLGGSALGGIDNGKRNSFRKIDFTNADLRQTAHKSADFVDCIFHDANLSKVDFQGSVFVNCTFEGGLNKVIFYRRAFRGEAFPPNEMKGVDFRRAHFRFVEFRGLDMTEVKCPEGDDHILLKDYKRTLNRMIQVLKTRSDASSKKIAAMLASHLKWAGQHQEQGLISKHDLIDVGGDEAVSEVLRLAVSE